ncbi:MAG: polysaccharide biosynthesis/export family protein [Cycloclasticus sp.]|nr:polysaccharide biosynthesis/export family protein [Cycloclasticus sp.]
MTLILVGNAAIAADRYLLNPGDILDVSVWKETTLVKTVIVLPDGMISFPLAGEILAEGKSVTELQLALKKKLTEFLSDPLVTIVVSSVSGNTVHVLGKISNPGSFVMNRRFNVMQALSMAGGLSPYAEENNISVIRGDKVIHVRYADIKGGDVSSNIKLKSGDVIVVP